MKHISRALILTLAVLVFAAPAAFASSITGADTEPAPGASSVALDITNDADSRGIAFSVVLENISAASVSLDGITINLTELPRRQSNGGDQYMSARDGESDLMAGTHAGAVTVDVTVDGVTGDQARLIICGANPHTNPLFVGTENDPSSEFASCDTILITVKAGIVASIVGSCPTFGETYEGGGVAVHVLASVNVGNFVSLDLLSIMKDGGAASPVNAPEVTGLGLVDAPNSEELILSWATGAGDAGTWEFCFQAENDLGDLSDVCFTVVVGVPGGDHVAWLPQQLVFNDGGGAFAATLQNSATYSFDTTFSTVMPYIFSTASGGAFFAAAILTTDITLDPGWSTFESPSLNHYGNDGVSPDTLLFGMINLVDPGLLPGTYTNDIATSVQDVEGIIAIDTLILPPSNVLSWDVINVVTVFPTYSPGCYAATIIRNLAPSVSCPVTAVGPIIFGDPVSVPGFSFSDPDDAPGPYTFRVVSSSLDGTPASPTNAPGFNGGDTFEWETSNADEADVGVWEFCVVVNDGNADAEQACCFTVEVIAQVPVVCFSFGCVEDQLTNAPVCVPLSIDNTDDCKDLGGFDLLFTYDATMLTFTGMDLVGSVLEDAGWEYFTYRIVATNPAKIRVVAIADINNSNQHPDDLCLDGLLANVCFRTTADQNAGCQSAQVQFYWDDCGDNTASSPDGNTLYMITDPDGSTPWAGGDPGQGINGGGIIANSCSIIYQLATFEGSTTGPLGHPCPGDDPEKPAPEESLYFVNGKVTIICPGDIDDRGDINLNGLAYEIADAVLYSNYFIQGPSALTIDVAAQTAASDVNADGTPLTVADLVYLIRVITGDASPIVGDLLGGGPKVAATVGSLDIVATQQGSHVSISSTSELDMGAGLFVFNYENIDIASVTAVDRASSMDVSFQANNGELRVLVYNIEDGAKVAAGSGEILSISANGLGSIELVSVEAATFMGGMLKTNLQSAFLPDAYALHQNYPNPFNPSTSLAIDLPKATDYTLSVYNIAGQLVKSFSGQAEAGTLNIVWDGSNNNGTSVASGVYFYNFRSADFNAVRKMVMMK